MSSRRWPWSKAARSKLTPEELAQEREKLARLEDGGTPEHPIEVLSASQIEPLATKLVCLRCESPLRVEEHLALFEHGPRMRVVHLRCKQCGTNRSVYFRVGSALPS